MRRLMVLACCFGWAVSAARALPDNLARVDGKVWRSAQPEESHFGDLGRMGVTSVLNLREWHADRPGSDGSRLTLWRVKLTAGVMRENDLRKAVKILKDAPGPVLVHCRHGADRTGAVVALYRMAIQGWPRERALAEFLDPRFGHHAKTFPQIRRYLETVDIGNFKSGL